MDQNLFGGAYSAIPEPWLDLRVSPGERRGKEGTGKKEAWERDAGREEGK